MDSVRSRFRCGKTILYRELDENGQLIDVKPITVVEDSDARVALWLPVGTPTKKPELRAHRSGKPRDWVIGSWALSDSIWKWAELLIITLRRAQGPQAQGATQGAGAHPWLRPSDVHVISSFRHQSLKVKPKIKSITVSLCGLVTVNLYNHS